ncbi:hypothetical protein AB6A40_000641 [Gnathostoma spinigerum]|uniref:PH and SEC7 domain-containing protein 3 n=1 Tax=Gnathostoma spinigerum TaxID=75299 RepID=A0ABD6E4K1_9BILA
MTEVLVGSDTVSQSSRSPRYEAFMMTGEKMLSLDHKISYRYAEMCAEQLPPSVAVGESPNRQIFQNDGSTTDKGRLRQNTSAVQRPNPSFSRSSVSSSQSDHGLDRERIHGNTILELSVAENHSSVTVDPPMSTPTTQTTASDSSFSTTVSNHRADSRQLLNVDQKLLESHAAPHSETNSLGRRTQPYEAGQCVSVVQCQSTECAAVDSEAAVRLATRLFVLDGFKKTDVASHLCRTNDFGRAVAEEYCALFNFTGVRIDAAMRDFLSCFCLTGDSQERSRIMEHFAKRYYNCNPTVFKNTDEILALSCAILLLNTDLHGPNIGKRMSSREFINNLGGVDMDLDRALLKNLYAAIKESPIKWASDNEQDSAMIEAAPSANSTSNTEKKKKSATRSKISNIEDDIIEYKNGWVLRKCVFDRDGNRTPFGRRGWKMLYGRIRGMMLFLHKTEDGIRRDSYETINNCIQLHHSWAVVAKDYKKRRNVFKLITAKRGEFLFQTSDPDDLKQWTDSINYVAAAFSSPVTPVPVSCEFGIFPKPIYPSQLTKLSMPEQLKEHEKSCEEVKKSLHQLLMETPRIKIAKNKHKVVMDFFEKEKFYAMEQERYETYLKVLRERLSALVPPYANAVNAESNADSVCSSKSHCNPSTASSMTHEGANGEAITPGETLVEESVDIEDRISYKEAIALTPRSSPTAVSK